MPCSAVNRHAAPSKVNPRQRCSATPPSSTADERLLAGLLCCSLLSRYCVSTPLKMVPFFIVVLLFVVSLGGAAYFVLSSDEDGGGKASSKKKREDDGATAGMSPRDAFQGGGASMQRRRVE